MRISKVGLMVVLMFACAVASSKAIADNCYYGGTPVTMTFFANNRSIWLRPAIGEGQKRKCEIHGDTTANNVPYYTLGQKVNTGEGDYFGVGLHNLQQERDFYVRGHWVWAVFGVACRVKKISTTDDCQWKGVRLDDMVYILGEGESDGAKPVHLPIELDMSFWAKDTNNATSRRSHWVINARRDNPNLPRDLTINANTFNNMVYCTALVGPDHKLYGVDTGRCLDLPDPQLFGTCPAVEY